MNTIQRFRTKYIIDQETGCWNWTGAKSHSGTGYGLFSFNGETMGAHRASYLLHIGDIQGQHVLHKCDNKACVNPEHLFLGTHAENIQDHYNKGKAIRPIIRSRAVQMYLRGDTFADIYKEIGITEDNVRLAVLESGCAQVLHANERQERYNIKNISGSMLECFKLWLQGYKYEKIAEILEISVGTVRSRVHRAKDLNINGKPARRSLCKV